MLTADIIPSKFWETVNKFSYCTDFHGTVMDDDGSGINYCLSFHEKRVELEIRFMVRGDERKPCTTIRLPPEVANHLLENGPIVNR